MENINLTKPRSRTRIEIVTDVNDDWFLHVRRIEKNGNVKKSSMIIRKDLDDWILSYTSSGWIKTT